MFQLWKLVLLCGLLTGTSESLLGDLGNDLTNVVENVKPALETGLETVDNTLDADLPKLSVDLDVLQKSKVWQLAKQKIQEAGNLMNNALNLVNSVSEKTSGVEISNSLIQDVKSELTADGNGINLRFPVTADVTVVLPLIGKVVDLKASLDLLSGVRIDTNVQNSLSTVVLGECTSDPINVSLSLLGRQVCPLIRSIVDTLDMSLIQNAIDVAANGNSCADNGTYNVTPLIQTSRAASHMIEAIVLLGLLNILGSPLTSGDVDVGISL
ncbi:PREDICTED: BPI fold-containing family A member 2 [Galeopterus variegatus]|uniref:BPI fold-containing family A member 2 n=1 Tax=Galeopterus variegatus TaxID=482537 RepID=A0ABM0RP16_GALVR|nr:PREDICTED: BPI fold-containing family A member 2 [Galeopterus variegatus]